jgi:hypothetical protein
MVLVEVLTVVQAIVLSQKFCAVGVTRAGLGYGRRTGGCGAGLVESWKCGGHNTINRPSIDSGSPAAYQYGEADEKRPLD